MPGFIDSFLCSVTPKFSWKFMWCYCYFMSWGNHFHSLSISLPFPMFPLLFLNLPYFTLFTLSNTFSQWWRDRTLDDELINNPFFPHYTSNKKLEGKRIFVVDCSLPVYSWLFRVFISYTFPSMNVIRDLKG